MSRAMLIVVVAGLGLCAPALAQTGAVPSVVPAEEPSASHPGRDYVDSRGCAFARGMVNGQTVWLSRVDGAGRPVCGLPPSIPAPEATVAVPAATGEKTAAVAPKAGRKAAAVRAPRPARAVLAADRLVIAVGAVPASTTGCGGPERLVPVVTLRSGARHAACDGLAGDPQAMLVAAGAGAIGPALPPLIGPATMVHVGAYHVPGNAERAAGRLRGLGLPVARGSVPGGRSDGAMTLVMTGPIGADGVRDLVARLRTSGFPDAYADVMPAEAMLPE